MQYAKTIRTAPIVLNVQMRIGITAVRIVRQQKIKLVRSLNTGREETGRIAATVMDAVLHRAVIAPAEVQGQAIAVTNK